MSNDGSHSAAHSPTVSLPAAGSMNVPARCADSMSAACWSASVLLRKPGTEPIDPSSLKYRTRQVLRLTFSTHATY